jgi:hypothetical protein
VISPRCSTRWLVHSLMWREPTIELLSNRSSLVDGPRTSCDSQSLTLLRPRVPEDGERDC